MKTYKGQATNDVAVIARRNLEARKQYIYRYEIADICTAFMAGLCAGLLVALTLNDMGVWPK